MQSERFPWGDLIGPLDRPLRLQTARRQQRKKPTANTIGHLYRSGLLRSQRANAHPTGRYLKLAMAVILSFVLISTATAGVLVAGLYALFAYATADMPSLDAFGAGGSFATTRIYDRNGVLLYELFDPNEGQRTPVKLNQISPYLQAATVAAEDPTFFDNPGVAPQSILRALSQNLQSDSTVSGASTITMQLVRNVMFSPSERQDRSYLRKLREVVLAYEISQQYSKDRLLEMYLNIIPYGQLAYGAEAAAQAYFDVHAKDLDLAQASLLAGLPQSPSAYNPLTNLDAAKARQRYVLEQMVKEGYINEAQARQAYNEPLHFRPHQVELKAPHFVFYVRDLLVQRYGEEMVYRGGLTVYTTLDYRMQQIGERLVKEHVTKNIIPYNGHNANLTAIDVKTGEILTMVGNTDYYDNSISGQVNMAIAQRQPGSSIKPFTYVTAFAKGYLPATKVLDEPIGYPRGQGLPPYAPVDFDGAWRGVLPIRSGLAESRNIPAVSTLYTIGIDEMIATARRMGVAPFNDDYQAWGLSLTLGGHEVRPLDITFAYQAFANGGRQVGEPIPPSQRTPGGAVYGPASILKILDTNGKLIYEYTPPTGIQVITPQQAFLITSILSDDKAREPTMGPNSKLNLSRPAAAKTGTTDNYWDVWTIGYTADLVVGVDVGNVNHEPMKHILGAQGAVPLWHNFMEAVYAEVPEFHNKPVQAFPVPEGVQQGMVCGSMDWYIPGQTPICWIGPTSLGVIH